MATLATTATALAATASTGAGMVNSNRAKHKAEREANEQNKLIAEQKKEALNKRKTQIDNLRYNLLGQQTGSNKLKSGVNNSIINDVKLG